MRDSTDRLEREVAAAFEEVLRARPDDEARLAAMIDAALKAPPGPPPSTGVAGRPWLKLLGGAGGLAVAVVVALSVGAPPRRDLAASPGAPASTAPPAGPVLPSRTPPAAAGPVAPTPSPASAGPWTAPAVALSSSVESPASSTAAPRRAPRRRAEPTAAPTVPETGDPDAWLRTANQARRARDFARADRLYDELRERFPDSRAARTSRVPHGRLLLDTLGRPADALACFSQYLGDDPRGTLAEEALVGRAQALAQLDHRVEMQAAWRALLAQFPESMHAPTARGQLSEAGP